MEARDYIDKFEELVKEYQDNEYLKTRFNTFEINGFTNDSIDEIPVEAGYVNIDCCHEQPWKRAYNHTFSTYAGNVYAFDVKLLPGDPASVRYYVRYDGKVVAPNITKYGEPNQKASIGTIYVDLEPIRVFIRGELVAENHKVYVKTSQIDDTAWELITDSAELFQSSLLRYEDVDSSKYYWNTSERALYKINVTATPTRDPWRRYSYELYGTEGSPTFLTYDFIKDKLDKYFYNRREAETPLYRFNKEKMQWETFGNIINYRNTEAPKPIESIEVEGKKIAVPPYIPLSTVNKERYYYFIPDDEESPNAGTLYSYDYTVFMERYEVNEDFYESAFLFYRELMHVFSDVNDVTRIDQKQIYCTHGHPGLTVLKPDINRYYLDTRAGKLYKPLENGFIPTEKPYNIEISTDKDGLEDLDPLFIKADTYYFFPRTNKCYYVEFIDADSIGVVWDPNLDLNSDIDKNFMSVDDLATPDIDESLEGMQVIVYEDLESDNFKNIYYRIVTLPNLPIKVTSLDSATPYFGAYYKVGEDYYKYNPYQELDEKHFQVNCDVFY